MDVTPVQLQPPLPAALHVLHRWAPGVRVEATACSAPIQFVSPWHEPLTPEQAAKYARLDNAPDLVQSLPRSGNRFATDQPERVAELATWLHAAVAPRLPPRESLWIVELLPYIAHLLVTWIAVDPDVLVLQNWEEDAVHVLHRTGDQTTRFTFHFFEDEQHPADPGGVGELLTFLLPTSISDGVHFTMSTGDWDPAGYEPIEREDLYSTLVQAVFAYGTAQTVGEQEVGRLAVRLLRDILESAEAHAGTLEWHAAGLPALPGFDAAGGVVQLAVKGYSRTAYVDIDSVVDLSA